MTTPPTSPTDPIYTAERIIAAAVVAALTPLGATLASGAKRVFWKIAEMDAAGKPIPPPMLIGQLQTPAKPVRYLGRVGAQALVTVRALHSSEAAAAQLAEQAARLMPTLASPGYTLGVRYDSSPSLNPAAGIYTAAHTFEITIHRNP